MKDYGSQAAENTDREIWRERLGDYYCDSIHVTKEGAVGINCGGHVIVMPVRDWHSSVATIESQAREIAELRAQLAKLDEKLSCGHRKLDHDDSYGGCTFCGFANGYHEYERDNDKLEAERDALRARAEAAEKAIKDHNDGCVAACEARQRGDYGQDCSAWISRKKRCLDCARDSMIDYGSEMFHVKHSQTNQEGL